LAYALSQPRCTTGDRAMSTSSFVPPPLRAGKKSRAAAPNSCRGGSARRLSFEILEGRCLLAANWLYAAVADSPRTPTNAGLLLAFDTTAANADSNQWFPLASPLFDAFQPPSGPQNGFSGLAFSADGKTLYATTVAAAGSRSRLLAMDAVT